MTRFLSATRKRRALRRMLRDVYTREGVRIWMAHHRNAGTPLDEQLRLAEVLATGAFS